VSDQHASPDSREGQGRSPPRIASDSMLSNLLNEPKGRSFSRGSRLGVGRHLVVARYSSDDP